MAQALTASPKPAPASSPSPQNNSFGGSVSFLDANSGTVMLTGTGNVGSTAALNVTSGNTFALNGISAATAITLTGGTLANGSTTASATFTGGLTVARDTTATVNLTQVGAPTTASNGINLNGLITDSLTGTNPIDL